MSIRSYLFAIGLVGVGCVGMASQAQAADLSRNAWIPYWKADSGIAEARARLGDLTSVSAFGFEVDANGKIQDRMNASGDLWQNFFDEAEKEGVAVYATISWFDGEATHETLSSSKKRKKHVDAVMRVLRVDSSIDGIEIDYESKLAETNPHFSRFLQDLSKKLKSKKKKLICDIESRTPLKDKFGTVTPEMIANTKYANDYSAIGRACDEVRIMSYDQGLADVTLVRSGSRPYAPVSDPQWVNKVIKEATAEIPSQKVVMGIPTYGRVWRIDPDTGGYTMISSITYANAIALAQRQGVPTTRNRSGELSFSYKGLTSGLPGNAPATGKMNSYFVSVSDAVAIGAHVANAKRLGVGGVALFKLDGDTDPAFWNGFLK